MCRGGETADAEDSKSHSREQHQKSTSAMEQYYRAIPRVFSALHPHLDIRYSSGSLMFGNKFGHKFGHKGPTSDPPRTPCPKRDLSSGPQCSVTNTDPLPTSNPASASHPSRPN